jgi:post-segregation antitoxin (ccd killing protein)
MEEAMGGGMTTDVAAEAATRWQCGIAAGIAETNIVSRVVAFAEDNDDKCRPWWRQLTSQRQLQR